jgi:hypothetical protein
MKNGVRRNMYRKGLEMYLEKIKELLEEHMTEKGYNLWKGINRILPDIWSKPVASTLKYHKKLNGEVPDIAEHVYQMLYAAREVMRLFNFESKTLDGDKILLAVALHDSVKYGEFGTRRYCDNAHDKAAADMISSNKDTFTKLLTKEQFYVLEEAIRFHSGRWSTDAKNNGDFTFKDYNPETMFVHMLDMLSSGDCLKTDMDYKEG